MMLDKFEYYPRNDAANGTVTKMRIETSLDGNHWSKPVELDWNKDNKVKTYEFPTGAAAQYVRLTPLASVGNFFSARELAVYKKDGTKMWEVGSSKQDPSVSENDFTNMKNYLVLRIALRTHRRSTARSPVIMPTSTTMASMTCMTIPLPWQSSTMAPRRAGRSRVPSRLWPIRSTLHLATLSR